jgi:hypothetical protein
MSYVYHNCWYKGFNFFRQLHYYCYCTTSCKTNNQLLLQAIQGHKKSFLTHQRKGISWADVDCTSAMSYLYHNCWYKGFNFFHQLHYYCYCPSSCKRTISDCCRPFKAINYIFSSHIKVREFHGLMSIVH